MIDLKKLGKDKLTKIGTLVRDEFDRDIQSRSEWMKRGAEWYKLFTGFRDKKNFPWQDCCFHENVEILTEEGWKYVKDVVVGENVFSREPITGKIELKKVTVFHEYNAPDDGLVKLSNLFFDIQVTGNHRFLLEEPIYKNTKIVTADEILEGFSGQTNYKVPLTGIWDAEPATTFFGYNANDFVELVGWYISEGWSYKNRCIGISQSSSANPEKVAKIISLLERLGFSYKYNGISFLVNVDAIIAEHFRELGNSHEKRIPRMYLDLPPEQLKLLFDSLVAGDGNITWAKDKHRNYPNITYYTTSKKLSDDFQELCFKLGYSASISKREPAEGGGIIRGKKVSGKLIGYTVSVRFTKYSRFRQDRAIIEKVPYQGKVYCVTVPEWETIYVRQNGKPLWTMNSNVHIPLLGTAVMQYHARAYDALFSAREIAKCFSTDGRKESIDAAKRASKYLNYQITEEIEEWEEEADNAFITQAIYGVAIKKTYYDALLGRITSRLLDISSFVAPYRCRRLEDAQRKTHYFNISLNEVKKRVKIGIYNEEAKDLKSTSTDAHTIDSNIPVSVDNATGENQPAETEEQILILEQHRLLDIDEDGILEPYIVTIEYDTGQVLSIVERWDRDPLTGKQITFEYFTSYPFIPNPESWCGFGFGMFMEGLNESANTVLNQLIDSGTLANILGMSGFINKRSGLKKGQIRAKLGEFVEVDANSSDFAKDIFQFRADPPSSVLFTVLGLLQQYSKEISSVSDSLLGKLPPSDTTATTMLAVMEQGMKVFSVIHKRNHRSFKKELKKIALLDSFHLPDEIYFMVQDSASEETQYEFSGKMDFANRIDVIPVSDPSITSRAEKLIKAKTAYEIGTSNPLLAQDQEFQYKIVKKLFEANEINDIEIPKPQPQELPDMSPEEEHASIIMEKGVHALLAQDHLHHLDSHSSFKESVWFEQLTPHGKKLLEEHEREHLSMQYLAENQPMENANGAEQRGMAGVEMQSMQQAVNV